MFSDFEIQNFQMTFNIDKVIAANMIYKFIVDKVFI
jgi:nitrate reductase NapAB chaperone NapD